MELEDINNFVETANEEQLKAFGFLGQWMMENVPKYCTCASKCNQNCETQKPLEEPCRLPGRSYRDSERNPSGFYCLFFFYDWIFNFF